MDALKQNIAEIDSAIIEARQWLREAETEQEADERRSRLEELEADLVAQQAQLDAMIQEQEARK
ncbi:hypothetical protein F5Y14DRAFT_256639 [Nemania sp. NC0429]|nr:hypothetical protein F5Y14DRAFT_256639 [Nemania sp. NC0429]